MGKGRGKPKGFCFWSVCGSITLSVVITVIVLAALSFPKVEEGQQAIRYDDVSNKLHRNILSPGIHTVQPDTILFSYPTKFESSDLEMICRTYDGIEIDLSITFQYTFVGSELAESYLVIGEINDNVAYMNSHAKYAIYETCSHYYAVNFTDSRALIEFNMSEAVENIMLPPNENTTRMVGNTHTRMGQFQLRNFAYPESFQTAVNSKQQTQQRISVVSRERVATLTNAETLLIQAQQRVQIQINNANAEAERFIREANLAAETTLSVWNQTGIAIDSEMTNLDLDFDEYINYKMQTLMGDAHRGIIQL